MALNRKTALALALLVPTVAFGAQTWRSAGAPIVDAGGKFAIPDLHNKQVHSVSYEHATSAVPAVLTAPVGGLAGDWKGTSNRDGDASPVTATLAKTGDVWSGTF